MLESEAEKRGREGEEKFRIWLDNHKIPYLYIHQDINTFSSVFKNYSYGKRPDFMVLIPNFGFIFVDVKNKKINPEYKTYPLDSEETKTYSSMQRKFNIQIWYVISNEEFDYQTWLWIPVAKVLESGISEQKSSISNQNFIPVPVTEFTQLADNDSLDRLFSKCFEEKYS